MQVRSSICLLQLSAGPYQVLASHTPPLLFQRDFLRRDHNQLPIDADGVSPPGVAGAHAVFAEDPALQRFPDQVVPSPRWKAPGSRRRSTRIAGQGTSSCRAGHAQFCGSVASNQTRTPYRLAANSILPNASRSRRVRTGQPASQALRGPAGSGRTGPVNPSSTAPAPLDHPIRRAARPVVVAQVPCYWQLVGTTARAREEVPRSHAPAPAATKTRRF
jgi:hypothetical protein